MIDAWNWAEGEVGAGLLPFIQAAYEVTSVEMAYDSAINGASNGIETGVAIEKEPHGGTKQFTVANSNGHNVHVAVSPLTVINTV